MGRVDGWAVAESGGGGRRRRRRTDALLCLLRLGRVEGRLADEQLEHEDAEAPDVDAVVVRLAEHLGREVVEGAAEGRALVRRDRRPAEVGHLCVVVGVEQDVLGLDVAVDHVVAVEEGERVGDLADPPRHLRLVEALLLLQQLEELAVRRELGHEVHALLVVEVAVQAEHARVLEPRLDLHLLPQLRSGQPMG